MKNQQQTGAMNCQSIEVDDAGLSRGAILSGLPRVFYVLVMATLFCLAGETMAQQSKPEQKTRMLFVPFDDLEILFEGASQHVFLSRAEYDALLEKAKVAPQDSSPWSSIPISADYSVKVAGAFAQITGKLVIETFDSGLHAVPLRYQSVSIQSAIVAGKQAPLGKNANGQTVVFLAGKGRHVVDLEMVVLMKLESARQSVKFQLPLASSASLKVVVPGNVELSVGPAVISRSYDPTANQTLFELVPSRAAMSLVMSVNNKKIQEKKSILAKCVLIHELTSNYEQIHARVNVDILYGATDRVEFELPEEFQISEVSSPELSQWSIDLTKGKPILVVQLRDAVSKPFAINIAAITTAIDPENWQLRQLKPVGFSGVLSVVGIVAEERFELRSLEPKGLIYLDDQQIQNSIPQTVFKTATGAPNIATFAAFFAPDANFELTGTFSRPEARLNVSPTAILFLSDRQQKLVGRYQLKSQHEKIIDFDLRVPQDWRITEITGPDGTPLSFQRFAEENGSRIKVKVPGGIIPGATTPIVFEAQKSSESWGKSWEKIAIEFPKFEIVNGNLVTGAIAVAVEDDLEVRPLETTQLESLLKEQKKLFGIEGFNTSIAYEVLENDFSAKLLVNRLQSRKTATSYSFLMLLNQQLAGHYEVTFDIQTARARKLRIAFPDSTPDEIQIKGLNGVRINQTDSETMDGLRIWTIELAEPRLGEVRFSVDFIQNLKTEAPTDFSLPIIEVLDVAYQTSLVSFEGNPDFDIDLQTQMRRIDVGEMGDADYVPGPRLQGAFSAVGRNVPIMMNVKRRNIHQLPMAIIQSSSLKSVVGRSGKTQTQANYQILLSVPFIELKLPAEAELWAVQVDGVSTRPQLRGESIMISLPPDARRKIRDLQIFYQQAIPNIGLTGEVKMQVPRWWVRGNQVDQSIEVPQADIAWSITLPSGFTAVSKAGSTFSQCQPIPDLPIENVSAGLRKFFGSMVSSVFMPDIASARSTGMSVDFDSMERSSRSDATNSAFPSAAASGEEIEEEMDFSDSKKEEMSTELPPVKVDKEVFTSRPGDEKSSGSRPAAGAPATNLPTPPPVKRKIAKVWSQKGISGLNISSLQVDPNESFTSYEFKTLSDEPDFVVTIVNQDRLQSFSFAYGIVVAAIGLWFCRFSIGTRLAYLSLIVLISAIVPLLGDWTEIFWKGLEYSLYVVCALVLIYGLLGTVSLFKGWLRQRFAGFVPGRFRLRRSSIWFLFLSLAIGSDCLDGQEDTPKIPVEIPSDAIIVPYDPAEPDLESDQIFIPYQQYIELLKKSDPEKRLSEKPLPASYGLSGARYQTTLSGSDLMIVGTIELEVFSNGQVLVPLSLEKSIITSATIDGQPATLKVAKQTAPLIQQKSAKVPAPTNVEQLAPAVESKQLVLLVEGKGRKKLELRLRLPVNQVGGWRSAVGRLPYATASQIELNLPETGMEVNFRIGNATQAFISTLDQQMITIPLGKDGSLNLSYRGKVTSSKVDQNLSVNSTALFDVRDDGLHLVWNLDFLFRASKRSQFEVELPKDFSVVRVFGQNIRGWEIREVANLKILDVTLLTEAESKESFSVELSNRKMDLSLPTSFPMPTVVIPDAAIHSGQITVRKSDQFELQTDTMIGISRIDISEARKVQSKGELLFQPTVFQAFEFSRTPFSVAIRSRPKKDQMEVIARSLIDIREKTCGLETRFIFSTPTPRHEITIELPGDLEIQKINTAVRFRKSVVSIDGKKILKLFLTTGLKGNFFIDIAGRLADHDQRGQIAIPKMSVLNATRFSGDIAAIAESQLAVQPTDLVEAEPILVSQISTWLNKENRGKARVALRVKTESYSGVLLVNRKPPVVEVTSITNVNVTLRSIEESIILNYEIRDAGIDTLTFLIPARLRSAIIKADLIREKRIEPVGDESTATQFQVTLQLQDFVIGQFRVLMEQDQGLTNDRIPASIPEIENVQSQTRFVTLQNSGFDELMIPVATGVESLDRRQKPFRELTALIGGADIRRAYLVNTTMVDPTLMYQTNSRKLVETVGASIGLSEIKMSVDPSGAYRVEQLLFVDNRTEPFLEIELPAESRLWTVRVAGAAVKPVAVDGIANSVRIPLVKTSDGDTDFRVELKFGGSVGKLANLGKTNFPFAKTLNINVESTNVRLFLPEEFDYYWFDGSLGVSQEKQIDQASSAYQTALYSKLQSKASNSKSDLVRQRALKNLEKWDGYLANENTSQIENAEAIDNRSHFNDLLDEQKLELFGNSGKIYNSYGNNFGGTDPSKNPPPIQKGAVINGAWFDSNQLVNPDIQKQNQANQRFNRLEIQSKGKKLLAKPGQSGLSGDPSGQQGQIGGGEGFGGGGFGGQRGAQPQRGREERNLNFKKQVTDNLQQLQEQSQNARRSGNKRSEVLRKYRQQLDRNDDQANQPQSGMGSNQQENQQDQSLDLRDAIDPDDSLDLNDNPSLFVAASLDVEFEHRGKEYLFQSPGGELQLEVTAVSRSWTRRWMNFLILFGIVMVPGTIYWAIRRRKIETE